VVVLNPAHFGETSPLLIAQALDRLDEKVLFRSEIIKKYARTRSDCLGQRAQRKLCYPVFDEIPHNGVQDLRAASFINRSGHVAEYLRCFHARQARTQKCEREERKKECQVIPDREPIPEHVMLRQKESEQRAAEHEGQPGGRT